MKESNLTNELQIFFNDSLPSLEELEELRDPGKAICWNLYYSKGFISTTFNEDYKEIKCINCYHPCNGEVKLDDGGRFKKVLDKVFGNSDNDNKTLQVNEAPSEQSASTNIHPQQRNSAQQSNLGYMKKKK